MSHQPRYDATNTAALEQVVARFEGIIDAIVYFVGFAICWLVAVRFLRFSYLYTRPSALNVYRRPGAWAVVTGASDGIGLAFANALASRGFHVVVHGRNQSKLDGVKNDLAKAYPRLNFRTLVSDASTSQKTEQQLKSITSQLSELPGPLTVLINNVGGVPSSILPSPMIALTDMPLPALDSLVALNMLFPVRLTRALIPTLARKPNSPSLIINIGSLASVAALPYLSIYSASKSFLITWSTCLAREMAMEGSDIEVLGIPVGKVTDVAHLREAPSLFVPSSKTLANACLDRVGCGRFVVIGYWAHAVQAAVFEVMPEAVITWVGKRLVKEDLAKMEKKR